MLPFGHTAISYLISQIPRLKSKPLKTKEVLFIIFCGNIFDFDFFIPYFFGYPGGLHHYLPTHTPLAGIIYFVVLYLFLRRKFSSSIFILAGLAIITHLILDDLSYWLSLLGLEKQVGPQIFWFYPFDPRRKLEIQQALKLYKQSKITNITILKNYLFKFPKLFFLEIIFSFTAMFVFIKNCSKSKLRK